MASRQVRLNSRIHRRVKLLLLRTSSCSPKPFGIRVVPRHEHACTHGHVLGEGNNALEFTALYVAICDVV